MSKFTISGKHIELTDALKKHAEEKTAKLPKFYDSVSEVNVIIDGNAGGGIGVEIIARDVHNNSFVAREVDTDAYRGIDNVVHKLEGQLKKKKAVERDAK